MKTNSKWEMKKLGSVITLEYGKPLSHTKRFIDGLYPVYGANGEKTRTNDFFCDKPSVIIGRKGSAGEINLTEKKFWPLDVTYFITFNDKQYDLTFLFWLLRLLDLPKLAKGVKPGLNRNEVYDIDVSIPDIREQQKIVSKLDKLFENTKKLEDIARRNLQNAKDIFNSVLKETFRNKADTDRQTDRQTD
ncbi:MAG: restriction endonuclease subunit S [Endomicrobium sp.]|uniref:restriction endonuclease subunit S n=1 Tax=Candidatus Endomicrobiellum pyrsonymphae TaxID=1408203 RepID=UPI0035739A7F|nr:restriction endonuclease subunit S [Endomicrobium sp.]